MHTDKDHEDPNYVHTTEDLCEHEVSGFIQWQFSLRTENFLDQQFTSIKHCKACAEVEDEKSIEYLAEMNEAMVKIRENWLLILEAQRRRVAVLVPRLLSVTHDEPSAAPAPHHT